MKFAGLVKTSLIDFPGYPACVVFVPGCNYNCFYCHNRELIAGAVLIPGQPYLSGKALLLEQAFIQELPPLLDNHSLRSRAVLLDQPPLLEQNVIQDQPHLLDQDVIQERPHLLEQAEIEAFLQKRSGILEGVVVTGGEPTLQPGLIPWLRHVKGMGYKIKLDTNGSMPHVLQVLLDEGLCDFYAVDWKAPVERYAEVVGNGASASPVLETVQKLLAAKVLFEVRTTVIPQLSENDLVTMAKALPVVPRYTLNSYRKPKLYLPEDEERVNQKPWGMDVLLMMAEAVRAYQPNIRV